MNLYIILQLQFHRIDHVERIFSTVQFHFVFNLAAETRYGQAEHVYASRCSDLSYLCATKSLEFGVKRFVEVINLLFRLLPIKVSTAFVYDHSVPNCDEASPIEPSIAQAKHKREAEIRLLELSRSSYSQHSKSMDIVILRPAIVYGIGDTHLLMTRIICATLYHYSLQESMNLPFSGTLGLSTVHIIDVCTAMWHCAVNHQSIPSGSIFNLCDKNETTQESV